jgi:hypothetical protein
MLFPGRKHTIFVMHMKKPMGALLSAPDILTANVQDVLLVITIFSNSVQPVRPARKAQPVVVPGTAI